MKLTRDAVYIIDWAGENKLATYMGDREHSNGTRWHVFAWENDDCMMSYAVKHDCLETLLAKREEI